MVVFGHKWLYSDKSGYILVKVVVIGMGSRIRAKLLYWGKTGCNRARRIYSEKGGFIRATVFRFGQKFLYSGKCGCIRTNWLFFWQKWLYSGKVFLFGQMWFYSGKVCSSRTKWL